MPRTLGGLVGFVITAILTVVVGLYIVNRVGILQNVVYGKKAA
jgi:hypothetical protein